MVAGQSGGCGLERREARAVAVGPLRQAGAGGPRRGSAPGCCPRLEDRDLLGKGGVPRPSPSTLRPEQGPGGSVGSRPPGCRGTREAAPGGRRGWMEPGGPRREAAALLGLRLMPPPTSPYVSAFPGAGHRPAARPASESARPGENLVRSTLPPPKPDLAEEAASHTCSRPATLAALAAGPADLALRRGAHCHHSSGRRGTLAVGW